MKYKVRFIMDSKYKVVELIPKEDQSDDEEMEFDEETVHTGSLADCEAYIRLYEGGYM